MNTETQAAAASEGRPLRIDIVSDFVCPWCYVGKRRLERALAARPGLATEIHWLPFQLSPDMPREGRDRQEHYRNIFGEERAAKIMSGMAETAAAEGLRFETKPGARSPNTLSAHVLLQLAQSTPGVDANALAEKLFAAHHCDSADIGDPAVLERLAADAGMDPGVVRQHLAAPADEADVQARIERAREIGVTGVPFFIFDQRYAFSGAQPADKIIELVDRIAAEAAH